MIMSLKFTLLAISGAEIAVIAGACALVIFTIVYNIVRAKKGKNSCSGCSGCANKKHCGK